MKTGEVQSEFLHRVLVKFSKRSLAIDALAEALSVNKDAIYRRLRGDTILTPDEMAELSIKFKVSFDELAHKKTNTVFFDFNAFTKEIQSVEDYVDDLYEGLSQLRKIPGLHMYYPSCEVPIFYYNFFPDLFCFKLFVWGRTIWQLDYLSGIKYQFGLFSPLIKEKTERILNEYLAIPSTELWSLNIFDNTLNQIEYHAESGYFENIVEAIELCHSLEKLARHMERMAVVGKKMKLGESSEGSIPFTLYQNEMIYTNNMILIKSEHYKAVHSSFCNPNFISSTDIRLCEYTENWFESIINKSTPLSKTDEKSRARFFTSIIKKIENTAKRLSVLANSV